MNPYLDQLGVTAANLPLVTLGVVVLLLLLVMVGLFRRPKGNDLVWRVKLSELEGKLAERDAEIREALADANAHKALATERKTEIERLNGDLSKLRHRLDEEAERQTQLSSTISRLQSEMKSQREMADEKIAFLTQIREDMERKFQQLAHDALKTQGEAFSKANLEKLEATLTPLKEHVGHFEKAFKDATDETIKDRERLKSEINQLSKRSEQISQEAVALTRALKGDQQKQGAWGEMILEGVLERSGLREGEEYETQAHRTGTDGERLRPDVVVKLPGGKTLIIDSKVSLVAYSETVNAETEEEAAAARRRHLLSIKAHINGLTAKGYQLSEDQSVDYVILFVPIEGALSEALREDGTLTEYALERHIAIATPTTLMMALRTVAHVWAVERRNRNAEQIAERAGRLYDKVAGFVASMETLGSRLGQAQVAYDGAVGQLSQGRGNVLSQVETLKKLGAKTTKSLSVDYDDEEDDAPPQINSGNAG